MARKAFLYHIRVLSFWIKRGYDLEWLEKRFLYHIHVLSFWIERGYDLKWLEKRFIYHIRVLSFWIKRRYGLKCLEKRFLYHIRVLCITSFFSHCVVYSKTSDNLRTCWIKFSLFKPPIDENLFHLNFKMVLIL